ncbi:Gas vesicle protein [Actinoplanes regularis]|uniref:Gas vesicle protein n=2 Tax=Actinoplanes regularis TaxID=52697 RepID=A0A238WQN0_9ACTN|nr:Gas vesicle protein [Actinoplanes regularis]
MNRMTGLLATGVGLMIGALIGIGPAAAAPDAHRGVPDSIEQISDASKKAGEQLVDAARKAGRKIADAAKKAAPQLADAWKDLVQKGDDALRKAFSDRDRPPPEPDRGEVRLALDGRATHG